MSIADKISDIMSYKTRLINVCNAKQTTITVPSKCNIRTYSSTYCAAIANIHPAPSLTKYSIPNASTTITNNWGGVFKGMNAAPETTLWSGINYSWNSTNVTKNNYYTDAIKWIEGTVPYLYYNNDTDAACDFYANNCLTNYGWNLYDIYPSVSTIIFENTIEGEYNGGMYDCGFSVMADDGGEINIFFLGVNSIFYNGIMPCFTFDGTVQEYTANIYILPNKTYSSGTTFDDLGESGTIFYFNGIVNYNFYVPSTYWSWYTVGSGSWLYNNFSGALQSINFYQYDILSR